MINKKIPLLSAAFSVVFIILSVGLAYGQISNTWLLKREPQKVTVTDATLGGHAFKIMLTRTTDEKAKGLMFFDRLAENEGMLFVYNSPRTMSFWMKNTRIPLDLVFFSENLEVTEWIEGMVPGYGKPDFMLQRYISNLPAQYALELASGTIARLQLKTGDRLEIPLTLLYSD